MPIDPDSLLLHLKECKLNEKQYKKLCSIVEKARKDTRDPQEMLNKFARKCYGKEPDRDKANLQAKQFLNALLGDIETILSLGTAKAMELKLDTRFKDTTVDENDRKLDGSAATSTYMKVKPLTRSAKSEKFSVLLHGDQLDEKNIENLDLWKFQLDRFLIGPTLGVGGTSKVKLAYDTQLRKKVALKILLPKYAYSAEKEIRYLKELNHKNIIKVYECYDKVQYEGSITTVFAIEIADGGELIEYLMYTSKFEPPLARWFFTKLIAGVEHCHSKNIVHRDLKHDNCLLGSNFDLKITDFGFARKYFRDDVDQMKTAIGTAQYAAPEILRTKPYTESVDIFSMGVMLFIALAGSQPWRKADPNADKWYKMAYKQKWADFWDYHKRSHTFSDDAKELLQGLLAHKPDDRWTLGQIKQSEWYQGTKYSDAKAKSKLIARKRTLDKKKHEASTRPVQTRKAMDEDDQKMFIDNTPPVCDLYRLPITSFTMSKGENTRIVMEEIEKAIGKLQGSVKQNISRPATETNEAKFEIHFEVNKGLDTGNSAIVRAKASLYRQTDKKDSKRILIFTPSMAGDYDSKMYLPQVFADLEDNGNLAYLRDDIAAVAQA